MGFLDALQGVFAGKQARIEFYGNTIRDLVLGLTPEELYRSQPHLRTVLSFVARNVAHLGVKAYERTSDTDRRRLRDDPLALLLSRPNPEMTAFELWETLASDLGLYDVAYWMVAEVPDAPSGWEIRPIPPSWVDSTVSASAFAVAKYIVITPNGTRTEIPAENMLVFHGWNPGKPKDGTSPVHTLKLVLEEQMQSWMYRTQVWKRGGRVGTVITRPVGAQWSDTARERFLGALKAKFTGDGPEAGGTLILEDGMTMGNVRFNAHDEQWVEASKVALSTVAGAYHVSPVMVGILDNANFSNTKEFRKMLYSETLGPTLARIEDRLNTFLVPKITKRANVYVEFNIEEKLQGDFEEQGAILQTATGAPWMTRNEARALRNLPAVAGGDELVVPLNVLVGGLASPRDTAPKSVGEMPHGPAHVIDETTRVVELKATRIGSRQIKSTDVATEEHVAAAEQVLKRFFARQRKTVLSELGSKDPDWWDGDRWDSELSDDLYRLAVTTATQLGREQAKALGFTGDDYDEDRTLAFLRAVADSRAGAVNSTTRDRIQKALDDGDDVGDVFDEAEDTRSTSGATALIAGLAGFAVAEVAKQLIGDQATKTWDTGANPRASHAAMDGETVGLDDTFSNGMKWPGDAAGGADEVAGCNCGLSINF